ncbi:hypothetical protein pb186bvf_018478 [Paramecium bursaria]
MGNKQNRIEQFDYKQFLLILNEEQQLNLPEGQQVSSQLLNQFRCIYADHNDNHIEGICVTEDCKAKNRRTCYDCLNERIHDKDQLFSFSLNKPLNANQLNILIVKYKKIMNKQIDFLQYFLYIEQLDLTNENNLHLACIKVQKLEQINTYIEKLIENSQLISIEQYVKQQYDTNIGIYQYFYKFYEKIDEINKLEKNYMTLKSNIQNFIDIQTNINDIESFHTIKKKKNIIIDKITKTQKYKNREISEFDTKFITLQIKSTNEQGKVLLQQKQYEQAMLCFVLQIEYNPNDFETILRMGNTYDNLQRFQDAIAMYQKVISLNPKFLKLATIFKGNSLNNSKRYQEAIEIYDQAIIMNIQYIILDNDIQLPFYQKYIQAIRLNERLSAILYHNKGQTLYNQKKYEAALMMFDQSINWNPQYSNAYIDKGERKTLNNLLKFEEAIQMFDKAILLKEQLFVATFNKGQHLNQYLGLSLKYSQKYDEAIQTFDIALEYNTQDSDVYINKGMCFDKLYRYEEANQQYELAIKLNPFKTKSLIKLVKSVSDQQNNEEAIEMYENSIKITPLHSNNQINSDSEYFLIQKYEEVIKIYEKSIFSNLQNSDNHNKIGNELFSLEIYEGAILMYKKAIQLTPNNQKVYFILGISYCLTIGLSLAQLNKYQEAIKMFDIAIKLDINDKCAYYNKGYQSSNNLGICLLYKCLIKHYIYSLFQVFIIQKVQYNNNNVLGVCLKLLLSNLVESRKSRLLITQKVKTNFIQLGECLQLLQRYEESILMYDKVIQLNPENQDAYYFKGQNQFYLIGKCLLLLMRYEESIQMYNKVIQLKPDYQEAYYIKGLCLQLLLRYEEAIQMYNKVIQLNPENQDAYYFKGQNYFYLIGKCLQLLMRYEESIQMYNKVIQLNPEKQDAYYLKGQCLFKLQRFQESIPQYNKVIQLNPLYKEAYITKGEFLYKNYIDTTKQFRNMNKQVLIRRNNLLKVIKQHKFLGVLIKQNSKRCLGADNDYNGTSKQAYIIRGFLIYDEEKDQNIEIDLENQILKKL